MMLKLWLFIGIPVSLLFAADAAYAYIDPGTGSMMIQVFIAFITAAGVTIGVFWRRLRSRFGCRRKKDK